MRRGFVLFVLFAVMAGVARAQDNSASVAGADTDPTKPVLFSVRNDFFNLPKGVKQNVATLRGDALVLKNLMPKGATGFLLRVDLPFVSLNTPAGTTNGLGDIYGQAFFVPRLAPGVMLGMGTGLIVPTASDEKLGQEKWIAAPVLAPIWFFPKRGFAYVKFQDWASFAGDDARADVHYFTVTPTWLWRIGKKWWTVFDAESNTNWKKDNQTSFRTGFLVGRMLATRHGLSLKLEVPVGGFQQTDGALKAAYFLTKF